MSAKEILVIGAGTSFPDPCNSGGFYNCDLASDGVCDELYYREDIFTSCAIDDPGPGPGCC